MDDYTASTKIERKKDQTWENEFSGIKVFDEVLEQFSRKGRVDQSHEPALRPENGSRSQDYKSGNDLTQEYQSNVPPIHLEATLAGYTEGINWTQTEGAV